MAADNQAHLPVVIRSAAKAEIGSAYRWYEREQPGLGEEFLEAVEDTKAVIAADPDRFPIIHRDIRRAVLGRFHIAFFTG